MCFGAEFDVLAGAASAAAPVVGAGYIMQMIASETGDQIICSRVEPTLPLLTPKSRREGAAL